MIKASVQKDGIYRTFITRVLKYIQQKLMEAKEKKFHNIRSFNIPLAIIDIAIEDKQGNRTKYHQISTSFR